MQEELDSNPEERKEEITVLAPSPPFRLFRFTTHRGPALVLAVLSILFYWKTLDNEYALDDGVAIQQNEFVLKGLEGIPGIFANDYYDSFYRRMNASPQLSGGRYRPLTGLTFALEQELIGSYRTGYFEMAVDLNRNGILDQQKVLATDMDGKLKMMYEYNDAVDANGDGMISPEECYNCWDLNKNFSNDAAEDLNADGVFNEIDCHVYQAGFRHFVNVLLFAICCVVLYFFFAKQLMPGYPDLAFVAALLFALHPVNSEVVANVKGREDLLSLLFSILTLHYGVGYAKEKKALHLILCLSCAFLAFLSKEHAIALLLLLPLTLHFKNVKMHRDRLILAAVFFTLLATVMALTNLGLINWGITSLLVYGLFAIAFGVTFVSIPRFLNSSSTVLVAGLFQVFLIYSALRLNAVVLDAKVPDTELLNNPFLFADEGEKVATKFFVLLKYLKLVFFPHPLVSDYSYNTISIQGLLSPWFILSAIVHLALLIIAIRGIRKKEVWAFGILVYLLFILLTGNLLFYTHIIMLESYLFHALSGACITIAWLLLKGADYFSRGEVRTGRLILFPLLLVLVVLGGVKAWERSADWKNDVTLFLKDVKSVPNSVLALGNAGARWIDLADTKEITGISIPGAEDKPFNDYNGQLRVDETEWRNAGYTDAREAAIRRGISYLRHAVELHPRYVNGYLNLGLAYYKLGNDDSTTLYWKMAEFLYPKNPYLYSYYGVYSNDLLSKGNKAFQSGDNGAARNYFRRVLLLKPGDPEALMGLGAALFNMGKKQDARITIRRVLEKDPGNEEAKRLLKHFEKH